MSGVLESDSDRLISLASQLSSEHFERFLCKVAALRRETTTPSERESQLLLKISEGLPPDVWRAYQELRTKKQHDELTPEDEEQIATVVDRLESYMADRVQWLGELAGLRNQSVTDLMKTLELESPHD
jgi:hypothetical protein